MRYKIQPYHKMRRLENNFGGNIVIKIGTVPPKLHVTENSQFLIFSGLLGIFQSRGSIKRK